MANGTPHPVADFIHQLRIRHAVTDTPDGELLRRFVASGDASAFELLLWRHERMVMGVCLRILRDVHDAEDAFQATFLVLARKARSIAARRALTTWLYTVAYRVSLNALKQRNRRLARVGTLPDGRDIAAAAEQGPSEFSGVLDEAVNSLPEKYRVPVVFCCLEGRSHVEAAKAIGCAPGTVSSRLARAKEKLRASLMRRGIDTPAGTVIARLGEAGAPAASAGVVVSATLQAVQGMFVGTGVPASPIISVKVAALVQGALKAMLIGKIKIAAAVLLGVTFISVSAGLLSLHIFAADEPAAQAAQSPPALQDEKAPVPRKEAIKKDLEKLEGTWSLLSRESKGKKMPEEDLKMWQLTIRGNEWTVDFPGGVDKRTFRIDPTKKPKTIDFTFEAPGRTIISRGIYVLRQTKYGETLTLCRVDRQDVPRPKEFKTTDSAGLLFVWKKAKK